MQTDEALMRLNRFRITTRIYAGFAGLIALGLAIAAVGIWQLAHVGNDVGTQILVNQHAINNLNNDLDIEIMRRAAFQYREQTDKSAVQQFAAAYGRATDLLKIAQRDTPSEARRQTYAATERQLDTEKTEFDRLVQLFDAYTNSNRDLARIGVEMVAAATALKDTAARSKDPGAMDAARDYETALLALRCQRVALFPVSHCGIREGIS